METWDKKYQYVLFAAEPYETVAFKIPNEEIDMGPERFLRHWDPDRKEMTLQLHFRGAGGRARQALRRAARGTAH